MKRALKILVAVLLGGSASFAVGACSDDGAVGSADGGAGGDGAGGSSSGSSGNVGPDGPLLPDGAPQPNTPDTGSSCAGLPATCGGSGDCCASNVVPGGTFNRSNHPSYPATVSDFKLDVYEVTVGRFRAFVNAGKGTQASPPPAGAGAHPKIPSSGWDPAFNANLAATTAALKADLACDPAFPAWTDAPAGNENRPIHCVTWFEAFAFCAWDGGRLPTEAEWNYAAAGGSEQRDYPWGATIDSSRLSYDCSGDGSGAGSCSFSDLLPVGSKPAGNGRWGHADLAGNVWEWVLDTYQDPYRLTSCADCAELTPSTNRSFRGGGFPNPDYYVQTHPRLNDSALDRDNDVGIRCARSAP